mgnify:CR=1 FL=1
MDVKKPKPDLSVLQRAEELLREQLTLIGEDPAELQAHEIASHMHCGVHMDGALSYSWKGTPILDVSPEIQNDGSVKWRFFTRETPLQ